MKTSKLPVILIKARLSLKLSQIEVADFVGVVQSTYNNWESGKHTPKIEYVNKLCKILNLDIKDIINT